MLGLSWVDLRATWVNIGAILSLANLGMVGHSWAHLGLVGPIWVWLGTFVHGLLGLQIWAWFGKFGHDCAHLGIVGPGWPWLVIVGPSWAHLGLVRAWLGIAGFGFACLGNGWA